MKTHKNVLYSFDNYLVEVAERRLWRDRELISITPKAFDTLIVLLEHKGRIVEKDVLLNEVWQDTFVEESTLSQNISTIRKILGSFSDGKQFIETVPRHGYRFTADVKEIIGNDEIYVVEHRMRTQVSTQQEKFSDEISVQPETNLETRTRTVLPMQRLVIWLKGNKRRFAVLTTLFCLTVVASVIGIHYALQPAQINSALFKQVDISKITANGNINLVTVSPKGEYLAMVEKHGENQTLLLRQFDNSATIEIVPPEKRQFIGVSFSPDCKQIYFATYDRENKAQKEVVGKLYKVSILGGQVQQIGNDIDSPIAISPDGRQFVFVRNYLNEKESALIIASFENKEEKKLSVRNLPEMFLPNGLAWSPDGKTIIAIASTKGTKIDVLCVNTSDGEQRPLAREDWQWAGFPNWLADGSGIILAAFSSKSGNQTDEIWQISYPEGAIRKVTGEINGIYGISLTADSKYMVAVKSNRLSSFWISPARDLKQAVKITNNLFDYNIMVPGVTWTPSGQILYGASINGNLDIWIMDADGSHNRQITTDPAADSMPVVSGDGQDVFYISNRSGQRNLWRMKIDGSEQKQLTGETGVASPSLSPDGKYIFYTSVDKTTLQPVLSKISIEGGESAQLTSMTTLLSQVSPDGKWIACYYPNNSPENGSPNVLRLTILSAENGKLIKQFAVVEGSNLSQPGWSDSLTLNYVTNEGGGSHLWQQIIDKNEPQMILDSPTDLIFRFDWSTDSQRLVYERGNLINEIVLIKSVGH